MYFLILALVFAWMLVFPQVTAQSAPVDPHLVCGTMIALTRRTYRRIQPFSERFEVGPNISDRCLPQLQVQQFLMLFKHLRQT